MRLEQHRPELERARTRAVARGIYRKLREEGFSERDVVELAAHLVEFAANAMEVRARTPEAR